MTPEDTQDRDLAILSPETRRVLEAHAPDYFGLDADARERRRAEFPDETLRAMRSDLLANALGKTPAEIEDIEARDASLEPDELLRINTLMQQVRGVGEDFFSWNEWLGDDENNLSFETIGAYDRDDHETQEGFRTEDNPDHTPEPYKGRLYGGWARYLENGELRYAILSDFAGFVCGELESLDLDLRQELVPHRYREGPEHNTKTEEGYIRWDLQLDAGGSEARYEVLSTAARDYISERIEILRDKAMAEQDATVWLFPETDWEGGVDPDGTYLVFASPAAMDAVRVRHLRADCAAQAGDLDDLKKKIAVERDALEAMLRAKNDALLAEEQAGA